MCRPSVEQRNYYNGHKRYHYLKSQGVFVDFFGPAIGIRHDLRLLSESELCGRISEPDIWSIYGDPAYYHAPKIISGYPGKQLNREQTAFNHKINSLRVTVEWAFGRILNLWNGLRLVKSFKVGLQPVGLYYNCAVILYNIHCVIHPNQISQYFDCNPFSWDDYKHVCSENCQF